jgi:hypothetical protein
MVRKAISRIILPVLYIWGFLGLPVLFGIDETAG